MNITVKKFIDYLKEYSKVSSKDFTKMSLGDIYEYIDRQAATENFIRLLNIPPNEWNEYVELYYEFHILSRYLLDSPLNVRESFSIILYFIQKNIATGLLDMGKEVQVLDPKKNMTYKFTSFSQDEAIKFLYQKEYKKLLTEEEDMLSLEQKQRKEELLKFSDECMIDGSNIISEHRKIQKHYLDKKETYDMKDVEIIVSTLKDMKVDQNLCESIKNMLIKQIEKRAKQNKTGNYKSFRVSETSKVMSKKEYYMLQKEAEKYRNIVNEGYIHISDSIHLVSLLKQLNYTENEMKDILKEIDKKNRQHFDKINPVIQYLSLIHISEPTRRP